MPLIFTLAQILWFFLPAIAANMAPVFADRYNWLRTLNQSIDGGLTWRGQALFGAHKTIRGFVVGIFFGFVTSLLQTLFFKYIPAAQSISLLDYGNVLLSGQLGILLGFGALLGDAAESFIKRRLQRAPGQPWRPFDQIDFVVGAIVVTYRLVPLSWQQILLAIIIIGGGSFLTSAIGRALKIKKSL